MQEPVGRSLTYEDATAALAGRGEMQTSLCYAYLTSNHLRAGIQALKQRNLREQTGFALSSEGVPPVSRERTGERVRIGLPNGKTVPTRF